MDRLYFLSGWYHPSDGDWRSEVLGLGRNVEFRKCHWRRHFFGLFDVMESVSAGIEFLRG